MTNQPDIVVRHIAKSFGRKPVLNDVSFTIEPGQTFALLGRNGAGKTTLLRSLLGLLKSDAGQIEILGQDPHHQAIEIRRKVGYLAEDQKMFGWMTVEQITGFMAPFYPTWDTTLTHRLMQQFELPRTTKLKHLSKGQGVRVGLMLALAHRPQVVILDDPALGLDPIMRKEFNRDLITHLQGEGRTVLYSSHLLYEVEAIADQVAILDNGRIVVQSETDALRAKVKKILLDEKSYSAFPESLELLDVQRDGGRLAVTVSDAPWVIKRLQQAGVPFDVIDLNLDEIFEAYVIGRPTTPLLATHSEEMAV